MSEVQQLESQYHMQMFRRMPVTLLRGEGTRVWDEDGKEYLDFVAGIATDTLGHAHPGLADVIAEQARTLIHVSNIFYSEPQVYLAQLLVENSALDQVFFANSGAEANEGAIKLARKWGITQRNGAYEIIATHNGFHGRTMG
ncbi:MAG: aminotransferase class III-fold pyridoxal phosphate-dependent enzyme, partial [Chloroflexi bacterium]|nr:aminotransferase class III-fold pyridoxal phosphate-dependent enzyme [Chloroflexota bacterium]